MLLQMNVLKLLWKYFLLFNLNTTIQRRLVDLNSVQPVNSIQLNVIYVAQ